MTKSDGPTDRSLLYRSCAANNYMIVFTVNFANLTTYCLHIKLNRYKSLKIIKDIDKKSKKYFLCVSLLKDLSKCLTNRGLLYIEAYYRY